MAELPLPPPPARTKLPSKTRQEADIARLRGRVRSPLSPEERVGLHRERQQQTRAARSARADTFVWLEGRLEDPDISLWDVLMVEDVLNAELDDAGVMRAAYLKRLGRRSLPEEPPAAES